MEDIINVVVPVYNAEAYMDRCLKSLTEQTYKNLKIYLVDDCSTDHSAAKCDEWAAKDKRITVIKEKVNQGSANARNKALDCVDFTTGYVAFVDVDDYVHPDYFKRMQEMLERNHADVVWVDVINTHDAVQITYDESGFENAKEELYTGKEILMREDWRIMYSMLWGKLYKASIWADIRLPKECRYFQDGATTFKVLYKAKRIVKSDIKLYYYYYSPNSATRSSVNELKCRCGLFTCTEKIDFYTEKNESELLEMAYVGYVNIILKNIGRSKYCENPKELRREMKQLYRENYMRAVKNKQLPLIQRLKYIVYRVFPDIQQVYIALKMKIKS